MTTEVIRWYAHNTHSDYTLAGRFWVWTTLEVLEMLLGTDSEWYVATDSPALLHATLRGRECMQLRVL